MEAGTVGASQKRRYNYRSEAPLQPQAEAVRLQGAAAGSGGGAAAAGASFRLRSTQAPKRRHNRRLKPCGYKGRLRRRAKS